MVITLMPTPQIGHGGARSDSTDDFGAKSGDITIDKAANIKLTAGSQIDSYAPNWSRW